MGTPMTMPNRAPASAPLAPRFLERIRLFVLRRLGDVDAADDLARQTLDRVTEAVRSNQAGGPETVPAFVFQTVLALCGQHRPEPGPQQVSRFPGPERLASVQRAIAGLRRDDRELLRLMYADDIEPEEIARRLSLSPGALRVRKHRALQRLAQLEEQ